MEGSHFRETGIAACLYLHERRGEVLALSSNGLTFISSFFFFFFFLNFQKNFIPKFLQEKRCFLTI